MLEPKLVPDLVVQHQDTERQHEFVGVEEEVVDEDEFGVGNGDETQLLCRSLKMVLYDSDVALVSVRSGESGTAVAPEVTRLAWGQAQGATLAGQ